MIGIIGAMQSEVDGLIGMMENKEEEKAGGLTFYKGKLLKKDVVVVKCGIGKVLAGIATEAMIIKYNPNVIINTGVAGSLSKELKVTDIALSSAVVQHDFDTTALGDELGYLDGVNRVYLKADEKALKLLEEAVKANKINYKIGVIASGDQFISEKSRKDFIVEKFGAISCEMEGGSIGHVATLNGTPFVVLRAISDNADDDSPLSFAEFTKKAVEKTLKVLETFIKNY